MYAFWLPGDYEAPDPTTTVIERFCPDRECACSQRATAIEPCWNCGGETVSQRPAWWPFAGANQTVRGGDSFSVDDLLVSELDEYLNTEDAA